MNKKLLIYPLLNLLLFTILPYSVQGNTLESVCITSNIYVDVAVKKQEVFKTTAKNSINEVVYQLFSHGRPGELFIDGSWSNPEEISCFIKYKILKNNPTIQHINIYGCEFAKGVKGREAVAYLENTLGISIAASTNITGKDGDWNLEIGNPQEILQFPN